MTYVLLFMVTSYCYGCSHENNWFNTLEPVTLGVSLLRFFPHPIFKICILSNRFLSRSIRSPVQRRSISTLLRIFSVVRNPVTKGLFTFLESRFFPSSLINEMETLNLYSFDSVSLSSVNRKISSRGRFYGVGVLLSYIRNWSSSDTLTCRETFNGPHLVLTILIHTQDRFKS